MRHDRQDPFSDPLSAAEPRGAERAHLRLRQAGILLYATGAVTLAMVLLAPDPDTSEGWRCAAWPARCSRGCWPRATSRRPGCCTSCAPPASW